VDSGKDLPDRLCWIKFSSPAWTPDGKGFYYSRYDEPLEGLAYKGANFDQKLYYHRLGEPQSVDRLIYERPDQPKWGYHPQVSEDGRFLVISIWSGTQEENAVLYQDLNKPESTIVDLLTNFDAIYEFLGNDGPIFYFRTDLDAPMYRVIAINIEEPAREQWLTVLPESDDALQSASLVGGKLVGLYLHNAHSQIRIFSKDGRPAGEVELPGFGTVIGFEGKQADQETYYLYSSNPRLIFVQRISSQSKFSLQVRMARVFRCSSAIARM
jgi:prolyl oligopeptidase